MNVFIPAALIIAYLAIGTLGVCAIAIGFLVFKNRADVRPPEIALYERLRVRRGTRLDLVRNRLSGALVAISMPVNWPGFARMVITTAWMSLSSGAMTLKSHQRVINKYYNLNVVHFGLPIALYAIGLLVLRAAFGLSWSIELGLRIGQICLVATLLAFAVSRWDLATTLRRGYVQPYLALASVVATFSVATVTLTIVGVEWPGRIPTIATVTESTKAVAAFGKPLFAYQNLTTSFSVALTVLTSFLLYYLVIRQIIQYKNFQRTAEDYAAIINSFVQSGALADAQRWLERVPSRLRSSPDLALVRIGAAILGGDWQSAIKRAESCISLHEDDKYPTMKSNTLDDRLILMVTVGLSINSTPREQDAEALSIAWQYGISDGALWRCVLAFNELHGHTIRPEEIPPVSQEANPLVTYLRNLYSFIQDEDSPEPDPNELMDLFSNIRVESDRLALAALLVGSYLLTRDDRCLRVGADELVQLTRRRDLPAWVYQALPSALGTAIEVSRPLGDPELDANLDVALRTVLGILGPQSAWHQQFVDKTIAVQVRSAFEYDPQ